MDWIASLANILKNFFISCCNLLIDIICAIVNTLLSILPKSPFNFTPINWGPLGDVVGVIMPVRDMVVHTTALTGCALLYLAGRYLLRLIKMVG